MCIVQPVWFGCDVSKHCSWKKFGLEALLLYVQCTHCRQMSLYYCAIQCHCITITAWSGHDSLCGLDVPLCVVWTWLSLHGLDVLLCVVWTWLSVWSGCASQCGLDRTVCVVWTWLSLRGLDVLLCVVWTGLSVTPSIIRSSSVASLPVSALPVLYFLGFSLICLTEPNQCVSAIIPQPQPCVHLAFPRGPSFQSNPIWACTTTSALRYAS